jgi:dihydroorotase
MPAFIDLHTHFRTPGFEHKETVETGSRAAARGGYTFVNCMPNTNPVCSCGAIAQSVMDEAKRVGLCDVNQCVSITKDFDGKTVSHLRALPKNLRFISEDGKGVRESKVMYEAMCIAAEKGLTVMSHAEDMDLSATDYRLAENLETARNLYLSASTGAKLHMCHVSTKEALEDILTAKRRGGNVTFEVTPHHIWFCHNEFRVNPPIRQQADVDALIRAMLADEVDAIATDHAPHTPQDKQNGAPGCVGLETAFSVCYTKLCRQHGMPLSRLSRMMSRTPAQIMGLNKGLLQPGFDGDVVLVAPDEEYTVNPDEFAGKSHNTPYAGLRLAGRVRATVKQGVLTYQM